MNKQNEETIIEIVGEQTTNLNNEHIEEARSFLTTAFGNYCGANSDFGEGCQKNVEQLELLWRAEFIRKNEPVPERKHPFLVVNEKKGRGLHREVNGVFQYCGNVNYFCKSCNMIYSRRIDDVVSEANVSYNVMKSKRVRVPFINKLKTFLIHNTHVCQKEVFNKWSRADEFRTTQETVQNAYDQYFDIIFDEIEIAEYGIKCRYKKCNGTHIIIKGEPPVFTKEVLDQVAFGKDQKPKKKEPTNYFNS